MSILIGEGTLTATEVVRVARQGARAALAPAAVARMRQSRARIEAAATGEAAVYGITTGFGGLANTRIPRAARVMLQHALLRSHAAGLGPPLPPEVVRAMILLRAATLARGPAAVAEPARLGMARAGRPAALAGQAGRARIMVPVWAGDHTSFRQSASWLLGPGKSQSAVGVGGTGGWEKASRSMLDRPAGVPGRRSTGRRAAGRRR